MKFLTIILFHSIPDVIQHSDEVIPIFIFSFYIVNLEEVLFFERIKAFPKSQIANGVWLFVIKLSWYIFVLSETKNGLKANFLSVWTSRISSKWLGSRNWNCRDEKIECVGSKCFCFNLYDVYWFFMSYICFIQGYAKHLN